MMEVNTVYYTTMLLGFTVIAIATFFEVKSVYVLVITYGEPCDRPLWYWLCGHIILGMLRELSWQPLKGVLLFVHVVWTFYGFLWFSKAESCRSSSPVLYNWVQIVLMIASIFLAATTLLPLTFYLTVMVLVLLVNHVGLRQNAAVWVDCDDLHARNFLFEFLRRACDCSTRTSRHHHVV